MTAPQMKSVGRDLISGHGITKTELFKFLQQERAAHFGAIWQLAFEIA
jgi:hypothetical protein